MSVRVKICGITRLADAEISVELGADVLGFNLEPTSRRCIDSNPEALQIPERLGPYVLTAAVLGPYRATPPQFHMVQSVDDLPGTDPKPSLKVLQIGPDDTVDAILDRIGLRPAVLLDAFDPQLYGGTGRRVDWAVAAEVVARSKAKIIIAGGLTPENVAAAIKHVRPYAVDVAGGVEAEIGVKDAEKLRAFIQAAKS